MIIVTFLDVLATVDVLIARNNDVKLAKTGTVHFAGLKSSFRFGKMNKFDRDFFGKYLTIIGRGWANYRDLSMARRSIICRSRRLRPIIDLWDTDKSRYFGISEFNNCFISRSPSLFFSEYLRKAKLSAIFHARVIAKHKTQLHDIGHG